MMKSLLFEKLQFHVILKVEIVQRGLTTARDAAWNQTTDEYTAGTGLLIVTENGGEIHWSLFEIPNHLPRE